MLRIIGRAAALAAVCVAFAGVSFAQMGTFMGRVVGADGKGVQNVVIKIERKDIKGSWQTKTNKKGDWIYSGMQVGGTYMLTCEVDGRVMDTLNGVRAQMGEPMELKDFCNLKAVQAKQAAQAKAMETGQLTEELARDMTPEQKAQLEKQMKQQQAQLAKNKALNDAFNNGMAALQAKDFANASTNLEKAAELDPKQYAVWANMAAAYEGLAGTQTGADRDTSYGKAATAYQKALEIKPDDAGVHNNYALLLVKQKKLEEAHAMLDKAAALDPAGAGRYYFNLGAVMVNTGQNDAALSAFEECVKAVPTYANCWYYKANVLSGKMTVEGTKAIAPAGMVEALEKYLALEPAGQFAEASKSLLSVVQGSVETSYTNPDSKKGGKKKK